MYTQERIILVMPMAPYLIVETPTFRVLSVQAAPYLVVTSSLPALLVLFVYPISLKILASFSLWPVIYSCLNIEGEESAMIHRRIRGLFHGRVDS